MNLTRNETDTRRAGIVRSVLAAAAIVLGGAAGLVGWSLLDPTSGAVHAEGEITVAGTVEPLRHGTGGIVSEILVSKGMRVNEGDPLVRLVTVQALFNRAALAAELDQLSAQAARLRAELDGTDAPDFGSLMRRDSAALDAAVARQSSLFFSRRQERQAADALFGAKMDELSSRRDGITARIDEVDRRLGRLERTDAVQMPRTGDTAADAAMRARHQQVVELRATRLALEERLTGVLAADSAVRLERAAGQRARIAGLTKEFSGVSARLAEIRGALRAEAQEVGQAAVRAPVSGVVIDMSIPPVGEILTPGEPILRIAPADARLVVEAELRPVDWRRLSDDMLALIRLGGAGSGGGADGGLWGTVDRLNAQGGEAGVEPGADERYRMIVNFDDIPDGVRLIPGMPVTVEVPTGGQTVIDQLLSPLRQSFTRAPQQDA